MEFELQIKNTVVFTSFHLENVRLCIGVNSDGDGFNFFEAPEFDKIVRHNLRIEIGQKDTNLHTAFHQALGLTETRTSLILAPS